MIPYPFFTTHWDTPCVVIDVGRVARYMASADFDPGLLNTGDDTGETPLHRACFGNQPELVQLLLDHPALDAEKTLNAADLRGETPLHRACAFAGAAQIVRLLLADVRLDAAVTLNRASMTHRTPVDLACKCQPDSEVLEILLADRRLDGARILNNVTRGESPLFIASLHGRLGAVKLLLADARLDRDQVFHDSRKFGWNPISIACMKEFVPVVEWYIATLPKVYLKHLVTFRDGQANGVIEAYINAPTRTVSSLQFKLRVPGPCASALFALMVFQCEEFLRLPDHRRGAEARMFRLAQRLPLELQMKVCCHAFLLNKHHILHQDSEPAFKYLASLL